jgi:hypothetical protein
MVFTLEQYRQIAKTCDSAAADHGLSPAQKAAFAHKADWYRLLSRLGDKPKWAMPSKDRPQAEFTAATEKNSGDRSTYKSLAARFLFAWQQHR